MSLIDQIYAQALLLAGELDCRQETLLKMLCKSAESVLAAKLRNGITPQDCMGDFVAAASLYALATLSEVGDAMEPESFRVGDVSVQKAAGSAASNCLRRQAELMIGPYMADGFSFVRV